MTQPPPLTDANGRPFPLDRQLASGGEGAVFALPNDPSRVAKVYHQPPTAQTAAKLTALIALANPRLLKVAAWPSASLLHAQTRQVMGFVMPRLIDCQPIQHLYNPVQRLKFFPRAGWTFQVRAAQNLAAAFEEVHKAGCLVGDVNQSNALVSAEALVRLIDCDSFQVRAKGQQYLCEVGVPHYTPPELQGKSFRGLVRTENHDRFGLAVLVYQLLFVGRHPYSGVYRGAGEPSFEELIAEFRFSQGPLARSWGMDPPPHTPTFAEIPTNVGNLFRRAFERGSDAGTRPRPAEWLQALKQLEQNTVECATDPGHKYWRGAGHCVWCRLEEHGGPEYYFGVAENANVFAVDEAKLQAVLRRLNACPQAEFGYERERYAPTKAPEPEPMPEKVDEAHKLAFGLLAATGFCLLGLVLGSCLLIAFSKALGGFVCATGFLGTLAFGVWLIVVLYRSPWHREKQRRQTNRDLAYNDLTEIEELYRQIAENYRLDYSELYELISRLISACRQLASQYQVELQRLKLNAEAAARVRHLRLFLIADADIPKIGAGRKQTLASYNIFTAADLEEQTIYGIKGFGAALTTNLMTWKSEVLQQFRFDPTRAVSPAEQRPITAQFRVRQQQMLGELDRQLTALESLAPLCRSAIQQLIPALKKSVANYNQAEADLGLLMGK